MFSKKRFAEWRADDVTQELYKQINEQVKFALEEIANRETANNDRDFLLRGYIQAYSIVAGWEPKFLPDVEIDPETEDEV